MLFRQLFDAESSTYTYLIADPTTKAAVLVDPVLEQVERDLKLLQELGLILHYCLETHIYADHVTGTDQLRQATGCLGIVPENAHAACADCHIKDGETLDLGKLSFALEIAPSYVEESSMPPTDRSLGNGKQLEPGRHRRNNGIKRHIRRTEHVEVQVEDDRTGMSIETLKRAFADNLYYLITKDEYWANLQNYYTALAYTRDRLLHRWIQTTKTYFAQDVKAVFYLSAEFLMRQLEHPDNWLRFGNPWEIPRLDYRVEAKFGGRTEAY